MATNSTRPAITAIGLRKSFGDQVVLDGIDLHVPEGTVFSLLGPNGAGKTTTVQILSTLIGADGGVVRIAGHDLAREPDSVRAAIGVTGQFSAVDNLLTGEENLILMADLHHLGRAEGRRRAAELLHRFDLVDAARKTAATYSGGMRRRLDLAMSLVGDPRIIFLDEPTTGLDPRSRRTMWQIIRDLVAGGVTVFLTTQYLQRLARVLRLLVRPEPVNQPGGAATRAHVASKQREQTAQPGTGDLTVAVRHPRQHDQLDGHRSQVSQPPDRRHSPDEVSGLKSSPEPPPTPPAPAAVAGGAYVSWVCRGGTCRWCRSSAAHRRWGARMVTGNSVSWSRSSASCIEPRIR
jgi:ABC-type Na+ transport system ATPase subunit NatA